jgi:HD-GYP domain-containing protein (c-di-GMP phosphodiesterase class II)
LGVSGDDLVQINYGAFLHDIGKLKIPDRILWKPGPLDGEEWVVMREHARYGYEFVRGIDFLKGAAEIVHAHHEKFNGAGYPRGLRGGDIPIGARIFAIVDAVDAMIYERPYQKALSFDAAQAEIRRSTGTHFDPDLAGPAIDVLAGGSGHDPAPAIPAKPA